MLLQASAKESVTRKALLSPWIDALGVGGLATTLLAFLLILHIPMVQLANPSLLLALGLLVNWPHFMASYRLLYRSREDINRHRWASIYIPAILVVFGTIGIVLSLRNQPFMSALLEYIAAVYLAWHYTGQGWGTLCTFAYVGNVSMRKLERTLLRVTFWVLLILHLTLHHFYTRHIPLLPHIGLITNLSLLIALAIFLKISARNGRLVPLRMIVPLSSLYLGYLLFAFQGQVAFFTLQISHALQYLVFTSRVEINRDASASVNVPARLALYYVALVVGGFVAFKGLESGTRIIGVSAATVIADQPRNLDESN